ncbi:DUF421 domain-containing protein [Aerococcaceae bacterium DSM 111020]|nr:DUF421 domain-containing protein [Aerococcaceae bacterium DSM 111020]
MFYYIVLMIIYRTEKPAQLMEGIPDFLIVRGKINQSALQKNKLKVEQLRKMLREVGQFNVDQVYYAILEVDGRLTVVTDDERDTFSIMVVNQGEVHTETLDNLGKDADWLVEALAEQGYEEISAIYYAELFEDDSLFVLTDEDVVSLEGHDID